MAVLTELSRLLGDQSLSDDGVDQHARCQDDYQQLKEEFERYKLRAQSVLKSKSSMSKVRPLRTWCVVLLQQEMYSACLVGLL